VFASLPLLACDAGTTGPGAGLADLVIAGPETLQVHETALLTAQIVGSGQARGQDRVTWTSSDPNIVRVDSGVVTGVRRGEAKLTARASGLEARLTVRVQARLRLRVMPSSEYPDHFVLTQGDSISLEAVPVDVNGVPIEESVEVAWFSSNPRTARVAGTGIVAASLPGNAVVSAMSNEGERGQIGIEVLWDGLETATVHLVHLGSGLGDVSFSLNAGLPHALRVGESVALTVSPGGLVVEAHDSAGVPLGGLTVNLDPGDDLFVYVVGNDHRTMLVPAWGNDASVPLGTGVVRLVQGSSWPVVYLIPPDAPVQNPPLECYFDPGDSRSFSRQAGVYDLVLQSKFGSLRELRVRIIIPSGASVTYVLNDDGVVASSDR
jgi:hypothetical protein